MAKCTVTATARKTQTDASLKVVPQAQALRSPQSEEDRSSPQATTALSRDQLEDVLTQVASDANVLHNLLSVAQFSTDDDDIMRVVDAAQVIVGRIGGMADSAIGGSVLGDYNRWNFGPNFTASGEVGAA